MKHLLRISDLGGADGINEVLHAAKSFAEVLARPVPIVPALKGREIVQMFFEDSTRTRLSFEKAGDSLSADVMNFGAGASALNKGESLRDTIETMCAIGADALVVRHKSSGVPQQISRWVPDNVSVINAGDGCNEHPTQALLECYTINQERAKRGLLASLEGLHIAIVGDIAHSRVARSNIAAFTALGARVTVVAPPTFLPLGIETWPVDVEYDIDRVISKVDVIHTLRIQTERSHDSLIPSNREYAVRYGLSSQRAAKMQDHALIMHAGPMNRGVEIATDVPFFANSVIANQVANGVAIRMAVLFLLIGAQPHVVPKDVRQFDPRLIADPFQQIDGGSSL